MEPYGESQHHTHALVLSVNNLGDLHGLVLQQSKFSTLLRTHLLMVAGWGGEANLKKGRAALESSPICPFILAPYIAAVL